MKILKFFSPLKLSECSCKEINSTLTLLIESKYNILKFEVNDLKSSFEENSKLHNRIYYILVIIIFSILILFLYVSSFKK